MSLRRHALREHLDKSRDAEAERWLAYRVRIVPSQLAAARRKVAALEREAERLGMFDLLKSEKIQ